MSSPEHQPVRIEQTPLRRMALTVIRDLDENVGGIRHLTVQEKGHEPIRISVRGQKRFSHGDAITYDWTAIKGGNEGEVIYEGRLVDTSAPPEVLKRFSTEETAMRNILRVDEFAPYAFEKFIEARRPFLMFIQMRDFNAAIPVNQERALDRQEHILSEAYIRARNTLLFAAAQVAHHDSGFVGKDREQYLEAVTKLLIDEEQIRIDTVTGHFNSIDALMREELLARTYGPRLRATYYEDSAQALENMLQPKLPLMQKRFTQKSFNRFLELRRHYFAALCSKAASDIDPQGKKKIEAYLHARDIAMRNLTVDARKELVRADTMLERYIAGENTLSPHAGVVRTRAIELSTPEPAAVIPQVELSPSQEPDPQIHPVTDTIDTTVSATLDTDVLETPANVPPPSRVIDLAADTDELERIFGSPEASTKPGQTVTPTGARPEELIEEIESGGVPVAALSEIDQSEEHTPVFSTTLRRGRTGEPVVILPGDSEEYSVALNGALSRDVVQVRKTSEGSRTEYEVVEVVERFPHQVVATVRLEHSVARGQTLLAYPDSAIMRRQPFVLPPDFLTVSDAPDGVRVLLTRDPSPGNPEWILVRNIGNAGSAVVEQEALALRTWNGPKYVEELTAEDIQGYARRLNAAEFPILKQKLEELDFEALRAQIQELEELAHAFERGEVSIDELVERLLPRHTPGTSLYAESLSDYKHGENRVDRREVPMLVMDPPGAQDHDDGLMFQTLSDGRIEVGIPIADPTAFIPEGSPLDIIARFRTLTQYFPKTLPLFPKALAEALGSLKEGEERLAFMTFLTYPPRDQWPDPNSPPAPEIRHAKAVVKSHKFVTYEQGQSLLEAPDGDEWGDRMKFFNMLATHYGAMRDSIQMQSREEMRFQFDDDGEPIGVRRSLIRETNKLIEHVAVTANYEAARILAQSAPGALVMMRVHEAPDSDKMLEYLVGAGYEDLWDMKEPYDPHTLLKSIRARLDAEPEERVRIYKEGLLVRAMKKAGYEIVTEDDLTDEVHFGLALRYYGHYTSPIRRYPDIAEHRLLDAMLAGTPITESDEEKTREYEEIAAHASEQEIAIDRSQRDMNSFLALSLLKKDLARREQADPTRSDVEAEVVFSEDTSATIRFTLPGDDKVVFDTRVSRNAIRDTSGRKLTSADWILLGKMRGAIPFDIKSIDPTLRRVSLQVDIEALYNQRGMERLKQLPIGTQLVAEVETVSDDKQTAYATLRTKNNRVLLKSHAIPLSKIGLSEEEREAITKPRRMKQGRIQTARLLIRVGPVSKKSGLPRLSLEKALLPTKVEKRVIPATKALHAIAARFSETYTDRNGKVHPKILVANVQDNFDDSITVRLEAKGSPKRYVINRVDIIGITDAEWQKVRSGSRLLLNVYPMGEDEESLKFQFRKHVPVKTKPATKKR